MKVKYRPSLPRIGSFDEKLIWIKITEQDSQKKKEDYGMWDFGKKDFGMWLDVHTRRLSSEKIEDIKRHRDVLMTRKNYADTRIEYQRSSEKDSQSSNSLYIDLYRGSLKVWSKKLTQILNSLDTELHAEEMGILPKWDTIKLRISGYNGAAFKVFRIVENSEVVFDLVKEKGCETVWIDRKPFNTVGRGLKSFSRIVLIDQSQFRQTLICECIKILVGQFTDF